jgi:hypothetical protein
LPKAHRPAFRQGSLPDLHLLRGPLVWFPAGGGRGAILARWGGQCRWPCGACCWRRALCSFIGQMATAILLKVCRCGAQSFVLCLEGCHHRGGEQPRFQPHWRDRGCSDPIPARALWLLCPGGMQALGALPRSERRVEEKLEVAATEMKGKGKKSWGRVAEIGLRRPLGTR